MMGSEVRFIMEMRKAAAKSQGQSAAQQKAPSEAVVAIELAEIRNRVSSDASMESSSRLELARVINPLSANLPSANR
jgi:hypothetical protein